MNQATRNFNRGYTLIELMVAISIIALLFAAGVASYSKATQRSRDAKRKADIEQIRSALEMYRADKSSYPTSTSGLWQDITLDLSTPLVDLNYIPALPTDPQTGFTYQYISPVTAGTTTYCIAAFLEVTNDSGNCIGYAPSTLPDGTTTYVLKNP